MLLQKSTRAISLSIFLLLTFCSCNSNGQEKSKSNSNLITGSIIDTIHCEANNQITYGLYLPTTYNANSTYPVLYFFDAHARGFLPIRLYKNLAEKYGLILVSSNVSKNGTLWNDTYTQARTMMNDVQKHYNIKTHQIYLAGFSGGARVACSLALQDSTIAGVIACGAGLGNNAENIPRTFKMVSIIGNQDFNWIEMMQLNERLDQQNTQHLLLSTEAKHQWPPESEFELGLQYVFLQYITNNKSIQLKDIVLGFKKHIDQKIVFLKKNIDRTNIYNLLTSSIEVLNGISNTKDYEQQLQQLKTNNSLNEARVARMQLIQSEMQLEQELSAQFNTQSTLWWTDKIHALQQKIISNTSHLEAMMYQRVLNYLGFIAYMHISNDLQMKNDIQTQRDIDLFKLIDPNNPDWAYLSALLSLQQGKEKECFAMLHQAADLGYNDLLQLNTEVKLKSIKETTDFKNILDIIRVRAFTN